MGLRINTNIASLTAQRNLFGVSARLQRNYARLASGLRIATAADDAAGLGISERMRAKIRSYAAAGRNAQDGISLVQTAEGALNEVSNQLSRLRELATQSANGTLTTTDRDTLDLEFQEIKNELLRISDDTEFNGIKLLDNSNSVNIVVGTNGGAVSVASTDLASIIASLGDVSSLGNASDELAAIDTAIDDVSTARGALGATQNRLQSAYSSIQNARENLSAAESRIRDVDIASETADLTRNSILQQAAAAVLGQANSQAQLALSLLNF